jgi:excisionase family DNA binding protein
LAGRVLASSRPRESARRGGARAGWPRPREHAREGRTRSTSSIGATPGGMALLIPHQRLDAEVLEWQPRSVRPWSREPFDVSALPTTGGSWDLRPSAPEDRPGCVHVGAESCKSAKTGHFASGSDPPKVQQDAGECREFGSVLGPPTLTVGEVAAILRVSTATVYKAIRTGLLPAFRVVGQFRVVRTDLERFAPGDSRGRRPGNSG